MLLFLQRVSDVKRVHQSVSSPCSCQLSEPRHLFCNSWAATLHFRPQMEGRMRAAPSTVASLTGRQMGGGGPALDRMGRDGRLSCEYKWCHVWLVRNGSRSQRAVSLSEGAVVGRGANGRRKNWWRGTRRMRRSGETSLHLHSRPVTDQSRFWWFSPSQWIHQSTIFSLGLLICSSTHLQDVPLHHLHHLRDLSFHRPPHLHVSFIP